MPRQKFPCNLAPQRSSPLALAFLVLALIACNLSVAAPSPPAQALPTPTVSPPANLPTVTLVATANLVATATLVAAVTPAPSATLPPAATATVARVFDPARFKQDLDAAVPAFMAANNVAGCAVALAYPDLAGAKLLTQTFAYGLASKATQKPVTSSTLFEIGSLSKLFTADVLALNVTKNLMGLDDPLQKYLPSTVHVPTYNQQPITLRQLATHTSGLPRTDGGPMVRKVNGLSVYGYATDDELFSFLNGYQLTRAPGSMWLYSNLANGLLGVAEETAGQAGFDSIVVEEIAGPLGLPGTHATLSAADKANLAQGYQSDGQPAPPFAPNSAMIAAGGLRSTAKDLAAYLVANIDPSGTALAKVLEMTQQRQSIGPKPAVSMGLGWLIANPGAPAEQYSKDGATAGFNTFIAFSRVTRTGFAIVCNGRNVTTQLAPQINQLLGASETEADDGP